METTRKSIKLPGNITPWLSVGSATSIPYTVKNLTVSTSYDFRVATWNYDVGLGDYCMSISVTTPDYSAPTTGPSYVSASAVEGSSTEIEVSWAAVTVEEDYKPNYSGSGTYAYTLWAWGW